MAGKIRKASSADNGKGENTNDKKGETAGEGIEVKPVFTNGIENPFDTVSWEKRSAKINDDSGNSIFEQGEVEVPADWSPLATNVVVSKYFYGPQNTDLRETSIRQLIHRVTRTITDWGVEDNIFASENDAELFYRELTWLCLNQHGAFNSPVWFNVGLRHQYGIDGGENGYHWDFSRQYPVRTENGYEQPQVSACFIQSVEDNMEDIMRLAAQEAMLFKHGSGTGTDLSTLRSSREKLSSGGTPSGPLSFMRVYDQVASVIKSGGKTRRAAKMQSLRCDHPDIREFIEAKGDEEKKAWALIEEGYDGSFNGEAYSSVMFQNANFSVRATDEFMQAAIDDQEWATYRITDGQPCETYNARELLSKIAAGTHICGDPGIQFHTTINSWHTCSETCEIKASNPCSEYMFINDSACNLASLNLMKFSREDGTFDVDRFRAAVRLFIIAQDIVIDHASYPSERICRNSHDYRPLGLGYANLGALLMSLGKPYDSDGGRATAAAITAILTATAYATSAELAGQLGSFRMFYKNRRAMNRVMKKHRVAVDDIDPEHCPEELLGAAAKAWDDAVAAGGTSGYRNAQATVLAPTGTIGFMMDCDTTGIEPDIALVKYKNLSGGGMFKIVNRSVPLALERLGYSKEQISDIIDFINENDSIEEAPHIKEGHLKVFDCAFKPPKGSRSIHYMGHIKMMAAAQPFISGAISKTVNVPNEATVEQITNAYIESWKLGLKAIAIYRDGSKRTQPLNTSQVKARAGKIKLPQAIEGMINISEEQLDEARRSPHRRRLPATRPSMTHKFDVAGHEGYITVGLYEDGQPGELFVSMAKEGSTVGGMMDVFATATSLCLQYGVPLTALVNKFTHQRFEPSGMTTNRNIPFAKSIVDYIFRWLEQTFIAGDDGDGGEPLKTEDQEPARPSPLKKETKERTAPAAEPDEAAPEAVTDDDIVSESGRNRQVLLKDDGEPAGILLDSLIPGKTSGTNGGGLMTSTGTETRVSQMTATETDRCGQFSQFQQDAPPCPECGSITVRNGNCYKCFNCGSSLGCS